ncbi:tetratricopeptide repeat protein [Aegicerativicinus sediminis]|uniref:tetratricopeptide repeat protein n=1 Tax=Aegicerativicinus sediminis TaxID=2893202 RepID=UPI001E2F67A8|nr:tetratricopeptide repeat protein [Aegicerativicinus sediminis]
MANPFNDLKKKQIWRSLVAYPAAAFVILQAVDFFIVNYDLNPKLLTLTLILLIGGFFISFTWNWNHGEKGIQEFSRKELLLYGALIASTLLGGSYYWFKTPYITENSNSLLSVASNRLAVLPFENKSSDSSLLYLSEGIPENFINRLSRTTNFKVLSRNSTFILEEFERTSDWVKVNLNADLVLTGKIENSKDGLVISCDLINTQDHTQIWGDKAIFENGDVNSLEDKMMASLLNRLPNQSTITEKSETNDASSIPEAQSHYMKGRVLSYGSTIEKSELALEHFRKAIEIDPKFAAAYVAIANEKIIQAIFSTAKRDEIFNEARLAVQTALAYNPNSAGAYDVDGAIKFYGNFDWEGAENSYRKSIELNPYNANAYIRYSALLAAMKKYDMAIEMADKAISLDPISISSLHNLGWVHLIARNFKKSEEAFNEALTLHPTWAWGYVKRGYAQLFQNKCDEAQEGATKAKELVGNWGSELIESAIIFIHGQCGNETKTNALTKEFFKHVNDTNYKDPFAVFSVYNTNDEIEKALDWAELCVKEKAVGSYLFNIDVFYSKHLLNHPRFIELRKEMNF